MPDNEEIAFIQTCLTLKLPAHARVDSEETQDEFLYTQSVLDRITAKVTAALQKVTEDEPDLEHLGSFSFACESDPETNVRKCDRCGNWASDDTLSNPIPCLQDSVIVEGRFLCRDCYEQEWEALNHVRPLAKGAETNRTLPQVRVKFEIRTRNRP